MLAQLADKLAANRKTEISGGTGGRKSCVSDHHASLFENIRREFAGDYSLVVQHQPALSAP